MATPAGNQSPSAPSPEEASTPTPTSSFPAVANEAKQEPTIFRSLSILDPILQFLTKATGQILVPFGNLETTLPALSKVIPCEDFLCLVRFGILRVEALASGEEASTTALRDDNDYDEAEGKQQDHPRDDLLTNHPWEVVLTNHWGKKQSSSSPSPPTIHVGFPSGDTNKKLCGSTKTAAKRRLAALKRCLKTEEKQKQQSKKKESSNSRQRAAQNKSKCQKADDDKNNDEHDSTKETETAIPENPEGTMQPTNKDWTLPSANEAGETNTEEPLLKTEREARKAFQDVLGLFYDRNSKKNGNDNINKSSKNRNYNIADDLYAPISASSSSFSPTPITNSILPKQLSYAGTQSAQTAGYESYSNEEDRDSRDSDGSVTTSTMTNLLHPIIADAFRLVGYTLKGGENMRQRKQQRNLYKHQALAISSALREDKHTLVCTGTGSGKSLCFLVPVLQRALTLGQKSLLLFPTKALAQDQLVKLQGVLETHPELAKHVSAAALDGDTPHSQRSLVAETCNVIFTNPDTLHASILPNWKTKYKELLRDLKYVVVDEAHMYEGVFGAHVAMILARLYRVHCVCSRLANENHGGNNNNDDDCDSSYSIGGGDGFESENHSHHREDESSSNSISISNCCDRQNAGSLQPLSPPSPSSLVFLACSATLAHPEHHFRLLCCIPSAQPVTVLTEDFSPRAAKHFFVWNPPLLDENGKSLGYVVWPKKQKKKPKKKGEIEGKKENQSTATHENRSSAIPVKLSSVSTEIEEKSRIQHRRKEVRRRHSADETALLLARAVTKGVRCIAFCKTRCLVEWVYERCIKTLKQSKETAGLVSKVDSYRGGYSKLKRREIEEKLFHNQLLGVVGTSALELGVDIGGVGLTLHCGFPSSHASLMQQAGRAGRGVAASHQPSLAICVCFNSPIDQHLWRHPTSLLSRGLSAPLSMPIYPGLVQGHLICAGNEFPLTGSFNASAIQSVEEKLADGLLSDEELFGSREVYLEALENLASKGSFEREKIAVFGGTFIFVFKTHPSIKKPWSDVSIRSIENVSYDIVDLSHPMQGNRMDGNHHEAAVMDNIPYSRVFYHAFPGAIITHRGSRYKIVSMTRPPAFGVGFKSTITLGAYAKPSTHRYCTRPLSNLKITVVKQMERVDLFDDNRIHQKEVFPTPDPTTIFTDEADPYSGSFAGCGIITVKRNVHGYKKISLVTRDELSRSELSLPDMEYDTFAFWIDCDATGLGKMMTPQGFGYGVHALSHALCNVAPLFVPCVLNDVQCDHSFYNPTRVVIFDSRAGGSGITAHLWKSIFQAEGLVQAAIDLLEYCPSCADDVGYTGGCPACIQAGECIKFNDFLCRSSALIIAKHMLKRMEKTEIYKQNLKEQMQIEKESLEAEGDYLDSDAAPRENRRKRTNRDGFSSPRRENRKRAMRSAMDIDAAKQRQLVIGRPSWPMDRSEGVPREQQEA